MSRRWSTVVIVRELFSMARTVPACHTKGRQYAVSTEFR